MKLLCEKCQTDGGGAPARETCAQTHTHAAWHYPMVAGVDVGHRSVQRLCRFEAVVSVNTTKGLG